MTRCAKEFEHCSRVFDRAQAEPQVTLKEKNLKKSLNK